jgi:hypothetical protein
MHGRKSLKGCGLNQCTVLYLSEIKLFWEYFEAITPDLSQTHDVFQTDRYI